MLCRPEVGEIYKLTWWLRQVFFIKKVIFFNKWPSDTELYLNSDA